MSICFGSQRSWVRYLVWPHTFVSPSADSRGAVVSYWRNYVHEVLVNRLGGLSLSNKNMVSLTDRPDMTLDVYRGRKTTTQHQQSKKLLGPGKSFAQYILCSIFFWKCFGPFYAVFFFLSFFWSMDAALKPIDTYFYIFSLKGLLTELCPILVYRNTRPFELSSYMLMLVTVSTSHPFCLSYTSFYYLNGYF